MARARTRVAIVAVAIVAAALVMGGCSSAMNVQRAPGLGKSPFKRLVVAAGIDSLALRRVTEDTPRPMQEVISDIPDWLVAIVDKLLAKEPKDRFQSAQELVDVIAHCQSELQAGVRVTAVKKVVEPRLTPSVPLLNAKPKEHKFPVVGVGAGVVLMFSVMAAGLSFLNGKNSQPVEGVSPSTPGVPSSSTISISGRPTDEREVAQAGVSEYGGANRFKSATRVMTPNAPLPPTFINSIGMEFVRVSKGTAWLGGGSGKQSNKKFEIEQDFYLGKYEVTQEEWGAVTGLAPSHFSRTGASSDAVQDILDADLNRFPVETVSWEDCQSFIERLNKKEKGTGVEYRLPKETEWEYACRGGGAKDKLDNEFDFYFTEATNMLLPELANFAFPKALKRSTKVGLYEPNMLGLYDMHGNVWEWCDDLAEIAEAPSARVIRGGCWFVSAADCRSAARGLGNPWIRHNDIGLRLALSPSGISKPTEQGADN